jgi:uncharacterized protein
VWLKNRFRGIVLNKLIVWDAKKDKSNLTKHKIDFAEAGTVFFDSPALTTDDAEHSWYEHRFITIGQTNAGKLIVVFYTETDDEIRIISARKPTRTERLNYEQTD